MAAIKNRFFKIHEGIPFFARVTLDIEVISKQHNEIIIDCEAFDESWKSGAEKGIDFALSILKSEKRYRVSLTKIEGSTTDTNPTTVGTASIFGVWKGTDYQADQNLISQLEKLTFDSWGKGEKIPDFQSEIKRP